MTFSGAPLKRNSLTPSRSIATAPDGPAAPPGTLHAELKARSNGPSPYSGGVLTWISFDAALTAFGAQA